MQLDNLLNKLFSVQSLTQPESHTLFQHIMQGDLSPEQLAGVLIALKIRGETVEEITGAVTATLENAQPFPRPDYPFADIVGTGGDGANTINISTASAIVAATMGIKVAKHGSRSVSSKSGASDVLSALGIDVNISAQTARQALDEIGLCFLFAPLYHTGFKHAIPVRQALKTRTLFNILGPLVNPARPKHQLLGVYAPELIKPYAETVKMLGHQHTIVVHGSGLDEVAIHSETQVVEIENGEITYFTLTPEDFGIQRHPLEALKGGEPAENAAKITALLQGKGEVAHIDAVAVNVVNMGSNLLRLDIKRASEDLVRVGVNTTFGVGGLINIADAGGIPNNKNSLGDTFASWGWKNSHYFVFPLLGPSTLRDSVGSTITMVYPVNNAVFETTAGRVGATAVNAVNTREQLLDVTDSLEGAAIDKYAYTRDIYMRMRAQQTGAVLPQNSDDNIDIDELVGDETAAVSPVSDTPAASGYAPVLSKQSSDIPLFEGPQTETLALWTPDDVQPYR